MKTYPLWFLLLLAIACNSPQKESKPTITPPIADNEALAEIHKNDQADRQSDNINWFEVSKRDSLRRLKVYELLDSNLVVTANDYHHAAMVFQHGGDSISYGMAVKLMGKAIELDSTINKWLFAAATDRYLLSKGEPQIYGTQYQKMGDEPWKLGEIDTTKISDEERINYGVETLAQQREKVKRMNLKRLSERSNGGESIAAIIEFIKNNYQSKSEFDLSEMGINDFGYHLMGETDRESALKIFKLNTTLFPNGFNTFDSYGECLMAMGRKQEAIEAYKKSLELNPNNNHAKEVIAANQ